MRLKPIAVDDFCAVRSLANVTFSPAGTSACLTVSQAKKEKNCYESRLYLLKDGALRPLTGGGKESSFCYLDENTVLFAADADGVIPGRRFSSSTAVRIPIQTFFIILIPSLR